MLPFSTSSGIATTVVDFTTELSPLLVGLVGLVAVSAGMIALSALRDYWSQRVQPTPQATPTTPAYRKVA